MLQAKFCITVLYRETRPVIMIPIAIAKSIKTTTNGRDADRKERMLKE
jgi:hypothetical protein